MRASAKRARAGNGGKINLCLETGQDHNRRVVKGPLGKGAPPQTDQAVHIHLFDGIVSKLEFVFFANWIVPTNDFQNWIKALRSLSFFNCELNNGY